ncbi:ABC transporter ATP-binding protein [Tychonema sp. LEGE 07199]|uniref:energy-coupling factor ABC transporter ATP-binding protein n=1 Tax=unclassified Tychonema TaxID=2642144 RepID=UPI00187E7F80|nr:MULTISPECIES: ABC transporter ATP-binding protein [unclassified Tychonema]MBE9122706.1 ABC transporter ATP-binding protein [Tychonema sp. LEGE 07199]MBE9131132.1 ABC transporter ATP-binding protein [Tychonema sp. LEGE 07196]
MTNPTSPPTIEVQNLVFSYPQQKPVLRGISFSLQPGERVGLMGLTGAGKSTLLENLIGLKMPQSGEIRVQGTKLEQATLSQARKQIGFCFQDANDQLFMPTILEDVMFGPRNYGVSPGEARDQALDLLDEFGLVEFANRSAHELSGGQRRLAALAAILALKPAILILDEPTNGLDPSWRRRLATVLSQLPIEVILIASHDLNWIGKTTQRALILADGEIKIDRKTEDLLKDKSTLESYNLPPDW